MKSCAASAPIERSVVTSKAKVARPAWELAMNKSAWSMAGATVTALVIASVVSSESPHHLSLQSSCETIPDGGFESGLDAWVVSTHFSGTGQHGAEAAIVESDLGGAIGPAAMLVAYAVADAAAPTDANQTIAEIAITTTAVVTARELHLARGGFWEALFFGPGVYSHSFEVTVIGPTGSVTGNLYNTDSPIGLACGFGISILGTNLPPEGEISAVDVLFTDGKPTGIEIGDEVIISLRLRVEAGASDSCASVELFSGLIIDDISFCDPARPIVGDLNGDGLVNGADLGILLLAWGECSPSPPGRGVGGEGCPPDLNLDGIVDGADLGELLVNWTV
jgi:hypothetical protein